MKDIATVYSETPSAIGARLADYIELTKPRISVMVLLTVAAGGVLASRGSPDWVVVGHVVFGTALVAAGASALNQLLERDSDLRMRRTENRPLPAGRLQPGEVLVFGAAVGASGVLYLALALPRPLAAVIASVTFVSYVFVYTPLKKRTALNTLIGAVPGALPPVIGWAGVRGSIDAEAMALFVVMFLWQVPHFLAIAWIHREDYSRAGLCMLPTIDSDGSLTGRQMVGYCAALIPASLVPLLMGRVGAVYAVGAVILGAGFLAFAVAFLRRRSLSGARGVLRASLVYLPALLALLLVSS
jgi:protoheme IX farnesyltransferase